MATPTAVASCMGIAVASMVITWPRWSHIANVMSIHWPMRVTHCPIRRHLARMGTHCQTWSSGMVGAAIMVVNMASNQVNLRGLVLWC